MNSAIKVVVTLLVIALIAVIGMIMIGNQDESEPQAAVATTTNEPTAAPQETAEPIAQAEESNKPEETAQSSETSVSEEAQENAQDEMYEGALAGLSEEEIAKMALAEEQSHGTGAIDDGVIDAGD